MDVDVLVQLVRRVLPWVAGDFHPHHDRFTIVGKAAIHAVAAARRQRHQPAIRFRPVVARIVLDRRADQCIGTDAEAIVSIVVGADDVAEPQRVRTAAADEPSPPRSLADRQNQRQHVVVGLDDVNVLVQFHLDIYGFTESEGPAWFHVWRHARGRATRVHSIPTVRP